MNFQHRGGATQPAPADDQRHAEFERDLAHKLGNLLQVVNGNLELVAARVEDERLSSYVANAQEAARQLTEIAHALVSHPDETGR